VILLLLACSDGPSPLTTVTDVRVLNLRVEPASPVPGEVPTVELLVVDPDDPSPARWSWWCQEDACDPEVVPDGSVATVFGFACTDCEGPGPLGAWRSWMQDLPFEDVNLAQRQVPLSTDPTQRLNENPSLVLQEALPARVIPEETLQLVFALDDATVLDPRAYGYATLGAFDAPDGAPFDDEAVLTWTAPETAGTAALYVVAEDGLGGSAVWQGAIEVDAP